MFPGKTRHIFHKTPSTYDEAQATCKLQGHSLVMPKTMEKQETLRQYLSSQTINADNVWIGLDEKIFKFNWVDGKCFGVLILHIYYAPTKILCGFFFVFFSQVY